MKKKIIVSFVLVLVILICTGCKGDVTRSLRHDGFNVGSDIVCDAFIGKEAVEKVKFLTATHLITTGGRIYELSLSQQYSNKSNCRVAETDLNVVSIFDDKIVKGSDGKYYSLVNQNNGEGAYKEIPENDNSYAIYDLLLKPNDVIKAVTVDSGSGTFFVLKSDGNVYEVVINKQNSNSAPEIVGTNVYYSADDYQETITDFGYKGTNGATFVRTLNHVYRFSASNKEECSKYADIACDYKMVEAPSFADYSDYILAYNGSLVITTYGKVFSVAA